MRQHVYKNAQHFSILGVCAHFVSESDIDVFEITDDLCCWIQKELNSCRCEKKLTQKAENTINGEIIYTYREAGK